MSLPLLVRPGSVIAVGAHDDRPDYDSCDGVTLQVYALAGGEPITTLIPTPAGDVDVSFTVRREGPTISVAHDGPAKPWRIALIGIAEIASVAGGTAESGPQGVLVTPTREIDQLSISLE